MAQAVTLLSSILEMSLSTLGQYTDYPDGVSPHLPSVAEVTCADVATTAPFHVHFRSLPTLQHC
jgi:hypothetical protein